MRSGMKTLVLTGMVMAVATGCTPAVHARADDRVPDAHCQWTLVPQAPDRKWLICRDDSGITRGVGAEFDQETLTKAEAGDVRSMKTLGLFYAIGPGVAHNPAKALEWFRKAADKGDNGAMFAISNIYMQGNDADRNPLESARWMQKSAEAGNVVAMFTLGMWYERGLQVPQDYVQAAKWYRAGAEHGHAGSMSALSGLYYQGHGVPLDKAEGERRWNRSKAAREAEMSELLAQSPKPVQDKGPPPPPAG